MRHILTMGSSMSPVHVIDVRIDGISADSHRRVQQHEVNDEARGIVDRLYNFLDQHRSTFCIKIAGICRGPISKQMLLSGLLEKGSIQIIRPSSLGTPEAFVAGLQEATQGGNPQILAYTPRYKLGR